MKHVPIYVSKKKVCTQGEKVLLKTVTYKNRMARKQSSTSGYSSQEMSVPSSPLMKYVFNKTIFVLKITWSTPSIYSGENLSEFEIYMLTRLFYVLSYIPYTSGDKKSVDSPKMGFFFNQSCSVSRWRPQKVDKRMVLEHTHGLFIVLYTGSPTKSGSISIH